MEKSLGVCHSDYSSSPHAKAMRESFSDLRHENLLRSSEVKFTKVCSPPRLKSPGIFHSQASLYSASCNSSKLLFQCFWQFKAPGTSGASSTGLSCIFLELCVSPAFRVEAFLQPQLSVEHKKWHWFSVWSSFFLVVGMQVATSRLFTCQILKPETTKCFNEEVWANT